ncbi:MAG: hypothetical protein ABIX28_05665 [Vicinamibacterales bacterium]
MPRRVEAAVFVLIAAAYAVLGFWVLEPDSVYSGDIGVKFVQARALAAAHFSSLDIPYPGQFLDPPRQFFPLRPPFVMTTGGETQAIFSPASAIVQALAVSFAGMRGMILVSLVAGIVILAAAWRLAEAGDGVPVLVSLGIAGPLWFYAISGWEHAPAVAFSTVAFALAIRSPAARAPLLAGLCLGAGATQRDEVLLLGPGLLLVVWLRTRSARPLAWTLFGVALPLVAAAAIEVWWFERPVAAHLRHAVHLLQSALRVSDAANPDVPALRPFTLRERYETVVQYWLLGYGTDRLIAAFAAGLAVALVARVWLRSAWGLLIWLVAVVAMASIDLHELVTAPKWLAGLHRVSPYLVFALFPLPLLAQGHVTPTGAADRTTGWLRTAVLWTTLGYLGLAFAGADTSGGKALGPRLLLPLMPLLTVVAIATIGRYLRAASAVERWAGRVGVLLVLMSAAMHLAGTVPAYAARNGGDSAAIEAIAKGQVRVVVADDPFTAQLLFPLYYRKIVFLADSPAHAQGLASALGLGKVASFVLVSRQEHPELTFAPYRLERVEQRGRMAVQHWVR